MASSNDIEVLDPTASVEKLKNIVSKVALNRRHFMAALGAAGIAAGTGLVTRPDAHAQQPTPTGFLQVDVLNFLLNIKYLKATFYSYLTQNADLPASTYVTLGTSQIYSVPPVLTVSGSFTAQFLDMFNEMYYDELNQVVDLRNILGTAAVNRPLINLAGTSAANPTVFAAPAATMSLTAVQAIAQARMLEDVSVTAFAGALTYLTGTNLAYAAQILAVDGCHAAALRLASIQNPSVLYQGSLYQSSFPVSTTVNTNILYSQLTSTKAVAGDIISGPGIPLGSVITAITANTNVTFSGIMTSGTNTITGVTGISGGLNITGLAPGQPITGTSLTGNNYIVSPISGTTITLGLASKVTPTAVFPTGYVTSGSNTITSVSTISGLTVGLGITGPGIQANTTIAGTASGTAVPTTITLSAPANSTPLITFTGVVTIGSSTITPVGSLSGLANGQGITGPGIPLNTYITNIGSNISMGSSPTGPAVNAIASSGSTTITTFNGILTSGQTGITYVPSIAGLAVGQPLTAGTGIPVGTTIKAMSGTKAPYTITLSANASASSTVSTTGNVASGSTTIANVQSISGMIVGQSITGAGIPTSPATTIFALGTTAPYTITLSQKTTATATPTAVTFSAITTAGSNQLTNVVTAINGSSLSGLVVGQAIIGPGIPTGTTITFLGTTAPFTVGMSLAATATFTPASFLCDIVSGSANLINVSTIAGLALGQCIYISGAATTGIPNNTVISAIAPNTISMASATTWTGTTGTAVTALTSFPTGTTITTAQILTSPAQVTVTSPALTPIESGGTVLASPALSTFSSPTALTFTVGQGSITISEPATATAVVTATIATSDPYEVVPNDNGAYAATITSGSATVHVTTIAGLAVNQVVIGTGIPAGTTITAINSTALTITLSAAPTASSTSFSVPALALAGPAIDPTSSPAVYQGFFATPGPGNASSTTPAGFAYARTFSQVLSVLYASNTTSPPTYYGGFFPNGVSGNINVNVI